ncbi:MAG TPA: beta-phosphoglucomutase [Cyclobacteriaceae bacterium]|nr:beta-phosphoglucomutase [Cyclobacteriaceae bacterium]
MIKACIFDLDGVIVDTAHYHFLAWQRLAKELGVNLTEQENERLKGVSRMQSLQIILDLGKINLAKERKESLADRKNEWFVEYIEAMKPTEIFPGVVQLITAIKKKGIKVALASSSKNAPRVIELLGIGKLFDAVVDGSMIVDTKPDPEIFLLTAQKLNIKPVNCVVFEDAEAGVEAAVRAGMKCVGVGASSILGKANMVVAKTADFKIEMLTSI